MPTPPKGPRFGGGPAHERLILANLATELFRHDQVVTTEAKAKRVRPLAERLITIAKRGGLKTKVPAPPKPGVPKKDGEVKAPPPGTTTLDPVEWSRDLAARRRVARTVHDGAVVHKLFTEIAPAMVKRPGGYTRIVKLGPRKGDSAPMAVIELVMDPVVPKEKRTAGSGEASVADASASQPVDDSAATASDATAVEEVAGEVEAPDVEAEAPADEVAAASAAEVDGAEAVAVAAAAEPIEVAEPLVEANESPEVGDSADAAELLREQAEADAIRAELASSGEPDSDE
ncbi:MAG: 50S ribosomal protein L17 [Bifidobacteriaceae bacterium]|jgi:large subunit ribosomal protein L17|nr:50S ribosomal protein L17 [Bifidobacteriaceae bacterium]